MQETIIFQPEKYDESSKSMHPSGTLDQWLDGIMPLAKNRPWLLFTLSFGFVGPLLKFARMDSFGVHIYKLTSQGKTTLAQACASIWGRGSDPAVDKGSYLCRWNHTANALSAVCASHNDCLLGLDEFGTCPQKDAERFIYDIFGGQERGRLNDKAMMREKRTWRVAVFSTGEISVAAKIAQHGTARGGHFVRMLDIPGGNLLGDHEPGKTAKLLKAHCSTYYGTAGPAFIQALIKACNYKTSDAENMIAALLSKVERKYHALLPAGSAAAYGRVMDRFALIEIAGLIAYDALGWEQYLTREDVSAAVHTVCKAWLAGNDMLTDSARGLAAIRNFILAHGETRFIRHPRDKQLMVANAVGYFLAGNDQPTAYLFETELFKDVCAEFGIDHKIVIDELARANALLMNEATDNKRTYKWRSPTGLRRFYAVKGAFLTDPEADDAEGAGAAVPFVP